jgi:alkylation response protein AidB-like acyl-CoA dehydrogenase
MSQLSFDEDLAAELVSRARALKPVLLRNALLNEQRGELTEEVLRELLEIDVWKMAVPRRWGGLCVSASGMARVAAELAKGCPSTAWVVDVMSSSVWLLTVMSDEMQEEVFAKGIPRVCTAGSPPGKARAVNGGYVLNGRWSYASGSHHSEWARCPVMTEGVEGPPAVVAVPMSDLEIEHTWRVAGMKGTGSDTLVAKDVFVRARRFHSLGQSVGTHPPGKRHVGEASDYWPAIPLLRSKSLGVLVGAAEGLLENVSASTSDRPLMHTSYQRKKDSPVFQAGIGAAAARIQAARTIMDVTTRAIDEAAVARRQMEPSERAAHRGQSALAVEMLTVAVDRLMSLAGSGSFAETSDAQRYWRDFNSGARHAGLLPDVGYEVFGRSLLGVEPNLSPPDFF